MKTFLMKISFLCILFDLFLFFCLKIFNFSEKFILNVEVMGIKRIKPIDFQNVEEFVIFYNVIWVTFNISSNYVC